MVEEPLWPVQKKVPPPTAPKVIKEEGQLPLQTPPPPVLRSNAWLAWGRATTSY